MNSKKLKNKLKQSIRPFCIQMVAYGLFLLACFVPGVDVHAEEVSTQSYAAFASKALLLRNGDLSVNEQFIFDYALLPKRGILRTIPLVLDEHGRHFLVQSISVTDKAATPYPYEFSSGGNTATIKIGDSKKMLTGTHFYDVKYTLKNLAGESELKWMIIPAVKEPIMKFQADLYFPIPVPEQTATATCAFEPIGGECVAFPLSKSGLTAGYRISSNTVKGQSVTVVIKYPLNLIVPEQPKRDVVSLGWILALSTSILCIVSCIIIWKRFGLRIRIFFSSRIKKRYSHENYSYLARAFALKNDISHEDVVATIADLIERGYLVAQESEDNDYIVSRASEDLPGGAEEYLCTLFSDNGISLRYWFLFEFPQHKNVLIEKLVHELQGVIMQGQDELLPTLKNFVIPEE